MEQLPVELLHVVCEKFHLHDLKRFRLVNKTWAAVGKKYLLPEALYFFHPLGCERLRETADHSEFRFHVKSLLYDGRYIHQEFTDRGEWEKNLKRRDFLAAVVGRNIDSAEIYAPPSDISQEGNNAFEFESSADRWFRRHPESVIHRTEEELEKHYQIYLKTLEKQDEMWRDNWDFDAIAYAVKRFPTLKSVRLSTNRFIYGYHRLRDAAFKEAFADTFCKPGANNRSGIDPPQGLRQLTALLTAISDAEIKLDRVEAGCLSWRFFAQEESIMRRMVQATRFVTKINLLLDTAVDEDDIQLDFEGAECREYLSHGSLCRFLQNMPNLTSLKVIFDIEFEPDIVLPATIPDIVGHGTKWPKLEEFGVGGIAAKEADLLAFLDDHKDTLRRLTIKTIMLDAGESWISTFPKIQQTLSLDEASLFGVLCAGDSTAQIEESWDIGEDKYSEDPVRQELARYLVEGGQCPLYLSNMHFRD
ncbi:hypothetical protein AOQ84DRAFT_106602 [Glonium stellatum]|uniref:F-box domain-containing protein n=1 Tax=Glonium stellatum TaxID=574774 RepID=A0A8E2EU96_9PEZI|nr:hypothetical protein AOQ84DRAFT_106602 [Glonium stellatum]